MADNDVITDSDPESLPETSGQTAVNVLSDTALPGDVSGDDAPHLPGGPAIEGDSDAASDSETLNTGLAPHESLELMGRSLVESYNTEVREVQSQAEQAAAALRQLDDAVLVRLDPTICPWNTVFEHRRHRYRWVDPETDEEQETLETEHCQSGLCGLGQAAEDSLWLRRTTLWNRFTDARTRLETLAGARDDRMRQAQEIAQQVGQMLGQSEDSGTGNLANAADTDGAGDSIALLDPAELALPVIEEPAPVAATDERTDEERRQQKSQLIDAIDVGTFDSELRMPGGGMDSFETVLPDEYQKDSDVWFTILQRHPDQAQYLPQEALNDPQFALKMLETRGVAAERALAEIPENISGSPEFILKLIETNWRAARDVCPIELKNNPEVALKALRYFEQDALDTFEWLGDEVKDNSLVMNAAVLMSPAAMRHASRRLRNDRDLLHDVLTASLALCDQATRRETSKASVSATPSFDWRVAYREESRFRIERRVDFWPAVETIMGRTLETPRDDDQVMLLAVLHDGRAMQFASDRIKSDRAFVLTALGMIHEKLPPRYSADSCRTLCEHLGDLLRDNQELALFAIECAGGQDIMHCWSERLRRDREFVLQALSGSLYRGRMLASLPDYLRDDEGIVELALATDGSALQHASDRLQQDRRFVLRAIKASASTESFEASLQVARRFFGDHDPPGDGGDIHWFAANRPLISPADVHESLRNDADVVMACIEAGASIRGAAPQLMNDLKFARRAIEAFARRAVHPQLPLRIGERLVSLLPEKIRDSDDAMLGCIARQGSSAKYASPRLRNNPTFGARAVQSSENARATLDHLARSLRDDDSVMQSTAERNPELAVSMASERLKGDRTFAFAAMRSSNDPESLRTQLSGALPTKSDISADAQPAAPPGGISPGDLWTLVVVILGGLLFGYVAYVLPTLDAQLASGTSAIRISVAIMLGLGFFGALNRVIASRREPEPKSQPVSAEPPDARLFEPVEEHDPTVHYTRGGGVEGFRPRGKADRG